MFSGWACTVCECPNESSFATCRRCLKKRSLTVVCNTCGIVGSWLLPNNFQLLQPKCGKCKADVPIQNVLPIGKGVENVKQAFTHWIKKVRHIPPDAEPVREKNQHICMLAAAALGNEKYPWETARWDRLCHLPQDGGNIIHVLAECGHAQLMKRLMKMNELRFSELMDTPNFKGDKPLEIMRHIKRLQVHIWTVDASGKNKDNNFIGQGETESFAAFDGRCRLAMDEMRKKVTQSKEPLTLDSSTTTYDTSCSSDVCEVLVSAEALTDKFRLIKRARCKAAFLSGLLPNPLSPVYTAFAANPIYDPQVLKLIMRNMNIESYFLD